VFRKLFTDHPEAVGETYGEHFAVAASFGFTMIAGGIACLVHALVPGLCKTTGSETIRSLYDRIRNRGRSDTRSDPTAALEWVI